MKKALFVNLPALVTGIVLVASQAILVKPAQAEIFKCKKPSGEVFYNDKPCPVDDEETEMRAVKDPENGYIPAPYTGTQQADQVNKTGGKSTSTVNRGVIIGDGDASNADLVAPDILADEREDASDQNAHSNGNKDSDRTADGGVSSADVMQLSAGAGNQSRERSGEAEDPYRKQGSTVPRKLTVAEKRKTLNIEIPDE